MTEQAAKKVVTDLDLDMLAEFFSVGMETTRIGYDGEQTAKAFLALVLEKDPGLENHEGVKLAVGALAETRKRQNGRA